MTQSRTEYTEHERAEQERTIAWLQGELVEARREAARYAAQRDTLIHKLHEANQELREARDREARV